MAKFGNKSFKSPRDLAVNYGDIAITHAVPTKEILQEILKSGKIKKPSEVGTAGERLLNKHFGIHDCVYLSVGWEYNSTFHQWPFAFIFRKPILKRKPTEFFKTYLISQGWMNVLRWWRENDRAYLDRVMQSSNAARKQVSSFLKKDACEFWLFEKELELHLSSYPSKREIFRMLDKFRAKNLLTGSYSLKFISRHFFDENKRMEIVSHKSISLDTKEFAGLYIEEKQIPKILPMAMKYLDTSNVMFDGKRKIAIKRQVF